MAAAFTCVDVIGKGVNIFRIAIVILYGNLGYDAVFFFFDIYGLRVQRRLILVKVFDKGDNTPFIQKKLILICSFICYGYLESPVQERKLPQPLRKDIIMDLGDFKYLGVRLEGYSGPPSFCLPCNIKLRHRFPPFKTLGVDKPLLLDLHLEPLGECVYYGHTNSVKPPGYFVCGRIELSSCVKFGKNDLRRCPSFRVSGMEPCGDAPSVVNDSAAAVVVEEDLYQCAVSRKRLINTVVDYFVNKVVKAVNTGGANIHRRPLSNSIKALKDFYIFSSVR